MQFLLPVAPLKPTFYSKLLVLIGKCGSPNKISSIRLSAAIHLRFNTTASCWRKLKTSYALPIALWGMFVLQSDGVVLQQPVNMQCEKITRLLQFQVSLTWASHFPFVWFKFVARLTSISATWCDVRLVLLYVLIVLLVLCANLWNFETQSWQTATDCNRLWQPVGILPDVVGSLSLFVISANWKGCFADVNEYMINIAVTAGVTS